MSQQKNVEVCQHIANKQQLKIMINALKHSLENELLSEREKDTLDRYNPYRIIHEFEEVMVKWPYISVIAYKLENTA